MSQSGSDVTPLKDFQPLATAIAAVNANATDTGVTMNSYTPSNKARSCPAVQANTWRAAEALPPTPNVTACENMVAASACVPTDALTSDAQKMASMFGTICGLDATACKGITSNATTGTYGDFVMCNTTQQLTSALNTYYTNQKKAKTACDFSGQAKIVTPSKAASSGGGSGSSSSGSSSSSVSTSGSSNTDTGTNTGTSTSTGSNTGSNTNTNTTSTASSGSSTGGSSSTSSGTGNETAANGSSKQSSGNGSGTSGAGRITAVANAGWAGSLLMAVGVVALTL